MLNRFGLCLLFVSLLSACSSVPERYAPWRDDGDTGAGRTPNLGDVPAPPNTDAAKAEMANMRQRLEQDRNNAYLAAQGIVPMNEPAPIQPAASASIFDADLAPPNAVPPMGSPLPVSAINRGPIPPTTPVATLPSASNIITSSALPSPNEEPSVITNSNVLYNYDPSANNDYTYGTTGKAAQSNSVSDMIASNDPSISIDWSALGGNDPVAQSGSAQLAYNGVTLGEPVAYFAHGSATLGPKDRSAIRSLAQQLKQNPQSVMLAGNSSKRTGLHNTALSRQANLKMATKRANAVMSELIKLGVKADTIYLSSYGDSIPNRRRDAADEAADRRVEIIFDKK